VGKPGRPQGRPGHQPAAGRKEPANLFSPPRHHNRTSRSINKNFKSRQRQNHETSPPRQIGSRPHPDGQAAALRLGARKYFFGPGQTGRQFDFNDFVAQVAVQAADSELSENGAQRPQTAGRKNWRTPTKKGPPHGKDVV
jgi:hypothetical protein